MNRKQRKQLEEQIITEVNTTRSFCDDSMARISVFAQTRPWTFVEITYWQGEYATIGYGFSKANWPDKWSATYGRNLAIEKAAAHIVRQVAEQDRVNRATDLRTLMGNRISEYVTRANPHWITDVRKVTTT